jgi:asparagine synthase (glutamine-hydrolysing)
MTRRMRHRGPDDEGYLLIEGGKNWRVAYGGDDTPQASMGEGTHLPHIREAADARVEACLGHRRLRIIDLSFQGHQPMTVGDGRFWIVFNGEIYNFLEIRRQLEDCGHSLRSRSDTEVVLRAYIQWGEACLEKFNGMFAFAIYDGLRRELFLARDRIGIKPLYYCMQPDRFIFASDIKTILASGLTRPEVDMEGLWHNLSFSVAPRPMTAFKGIAALEQAHWLKLILPEGTVRKARYWSLPIGTEDRSMSEGEAVELLETELTRSIQYRLLADVEVGTFMSGGIDSTTISAIASRLHPGINAFTLAYDPSVGEYDELQEARETAALHDMRHIVETVTADSILDSVERMVWAYEEPFCTLAPNFVISRLVARHPITVILNGLGGDELFAGYSHYRDIPDWKRKRLAARLWMTLLPVKKWAPESILRYNDVRTISQYYAYQFSNFNELQKQRLFTRHDGFDSLKVVEKLYKPAVGEFSNPVEALSYFDILSYIGNHHVYRIDQFTMLFSLEGRFPFLDHQLVEAAFRIPAKFKLKGDVQKYVLRQVAKKFIAPSCLQMKKKGFGLPVGRWMNRELNQLTVDSLEDLKGRDIFVPEQIDAVYDQYKTSDYKKVWHLVMTELWLKTFMDGGGSFFEKTI